MMQRRPYGIYATHYEIEGQRYTLISVGFAAEQREKVQALLLETLASMRDYGVTKMSWISFCAVIVST